MSAYHGANGQMLWQVITVDMEKRAVTQAFDQVGNLITVDSRLIRQRVR
jgi:hypothetical protein